MLFKKKKKRSENVTNEIFPQEISPRHIFILPLIIPAGLMNILCDLISFSCVSSCQTWD